jgi:hypothetical protein
MATRLQKLEIDEVSGVQSPANELPGFLVAKSTDLGRPLTAEEITKEVDRMESDYAILYSALQACQQYMTDAPPEVTAAVDTLTQYIEGLFSDDPSNDTTPDPNADMQPVQQSADNRSLFQRLMGAITAPPEEPATETTKATPKEEPTVSETATTTEAAPESTSTTKSAEPTPVAKELTDALSAMAEGMGALAKAVGEMRTTQDTQTEVLSTTLDRLSAVEARRAGGDEMDLTISEPTNKSTERGEDALRAALVGIARRPGTSVTLGRGS